MNKYTYIYVYMYTYIRMYLQTGNGTPTGSAINYKLTSGRKNGSHVKKSLTYVS